MILFPGDRNFVSTNRNKRLTEKYVPVEGKVTSTGSNWLLSEKIKETGFD